MTKRVLRVAVWHNLQSGGAKRALFDHIQGLLEFGHHVEIWCPPSADIDYLSLRPLAKHHIVDLDIKTRARPWFLSSYFWQFDSILSALSALDLHCRVCAKQINESKFDVLFANSSSLFYNSPIGRYVNLPSLIFLQEPYRRLYEALPVLPWIAPFPQARRFKLFGAKSFVVDSILTYALRIQAREELLNAKAFNRILVNSYFSRESVLRAYNLDSSVCYLGINTDLFEPCDAPKQSYVVGLGGISTLKRLNLAILAIASIPSSARPKLVWIGNFSDSSYERLVRDRAIDLSVDVEFKVDISDEELVSIVQTAAVMLYTSHLEPFGYAPLEANACGTAVVAIAEGGVRETIMQNLNGVLISRCSPEDLGKAISVFTQDLAYSAEMAKQARQHVIRYWSLKPKQEALETHLLDLADEKTAVTWSNTGYPLTQL